MTANFTDEQVGKRVVDQAGVEVGTVESVRNGDLYVEVGPDADEETLSNLRWGRQVHQEVHELRHEHVGDLRDDVIRLNV
jgi:hypothetical protein